MIPGGNITGPSNDQDTDQNLEVVHYDRAHREGGSRQDVIPEPQPDQISPNRNLLIERQNTMARDQASVLQSAADFDIHGGNFATVAGDSFTATRDLHITIHNHPSSVVRNNDQGSREISPRELHGTSDQSLLPPLPVQRSCDIYRRHLASKGRGTPLWIPEPNKNLPTQYQRNGIAIGDVGILTASGSFAFLFNICLPHDHPINPPNLPENFMPIHVSPVNIQSQSEFKQNSYLASASTVRTQSDGDSTGLVFESSAHDGAVLTMPVGSVSEDLGSTGRFRRYVAANMVHWYKYAYYDREYDVKNGDLRLVIGHDKTSFWGMATFSNSTSHQEFSHLKFGLMEGRKYGWEYSGTAEVRAGPDAHEIEQLRNNDPTQEDINYVNQSLFVRTMNATLPDKAWNELGIDTEFLELDVNSDYLNRSLPDKGTFNGGTSSNTKSPVFHKSTGGNNKLGTSRSGNAITVFSKGAVFSSPLALADHPSKAINSMLLENVDVGVKAVITEDQDWMSVINESDSVLPSSKEIVERIRASYSICQEEGILFLSKIIPPTESTSKTAFNSDKLIDVKANSVVSLGDVPGISKVIYTLTLIRQEVDQIKLYKLQCRATCDRCVRLVNAIMENSFEMESHHLEIIDQADYLASGIHKLVKEWASWNRLKCFLRRREIIDGITRLNKDIDSAFNMFKIISSSSLNLQFQAEVRQQAEMREALQAIITNSEDIKTLLNMSDPRSVEEVMGSLQRELLDSTLETESGQDIQRDFRAGLWMLHEKTSKLPPLADLTGQITNLSDKPTSLTPYKIYSGSWLDQEKVALRLVQTMVDPKIQQQFEIKISSWRQLKHPNVVPLYGYAHINSEIYTVRPWMGEGNVIGFIKKTPDVDRLKIVTDVAAGLEYLHHNGLVHGDLRSINVLFSTNGNACLSEFGISKILEDGTKDLTATSDLGNIRWMAPEVVKRTSNMTMQSDVWSFGMLCLEVLSGNQPYSHIQRDLSVLREIENSRIPPRPEAETSRGITDGMWNLLTRCWGADPKSRPSMTYIRAQLLDFRGFGFSMHNQPGILNLASHGASSHQFRRPTAASSTSLPSSVDTLDLPLSSRASKPSTAASNATSLEPTTSLRINTSGNNRLLKLPHYRESADDAFTEALLDPRPIVNTADGAVLSGTLEGLVQHLLTQINPLQDNGYRNVFLTAFQDFTTPEAFFSILSRCFYDAESNLGIHPEDKVTMQYNIFTILAYWLSREDLRIDSQLLQEINRFCEDAGRIKSSSTMSNKIRELLQLSNEKDSTQKLHETRGPTPGELTLSAHKTLRPSEISPHQLAVALTLLEGEKYKLLTPSDYLAHLGRHPGHNNIEDVYTTNNKIVLWVKDVILRSSDPNSRAQTFKFLIETATECRKLRNFSSVIAIATALHSDPIERLRFMRMTLSSQMHGKLGALKELIDVTANHRKYREALDAKTGEKENCVPWLPVHLKDLHNVLQRYPMVVQLENQPFINFQRYTKLMDRINQVLPYRPPDLEASRQLPVLEYIEKELRNLDLHKVTEDDIVARSKKFEAQEVMEYRSRTSQIRNMGFRSKKPDLT